MDFNNQKRRVIVLGDSRTNGYAETLNEYFDILNIQQFPDYSHQEIALQVENYLYQYNPDIVILITLLNDIIEKVFLKSLPKPEIHQRITFNPQMALENMKYYSERWSSFYPSLIIIWTIPDVPNLIDICNKKENSKKRIVHFKDEKDIYTKLKYMNNNWKNILKSCPTTQVLFLRSLSVTDQIKEEVNEALHNKYSDIRVWHNTALYKDGIEPTSQLANLFKNEIFNIVNNMLDMHKKVTNQLKPRDILALPSTSNDGCRMDDLTKNILKKLWERHKCEYDVYRRNPESHPNYEKEKILFMENKAKQMAFQAVYPSADTLNNQWLEYWNDKLELIFLESWEARKIECLDLLPNSSTQQNKITLLPSPSYNPYKRYSVSIKRGYSHHYRSKSNSDYYKSRKYSYSESSHFHHNESYNNNKNTYKYADKRRKYSHSSKLKSSIRCSETNEDDQLSIDIFINIVKALDTLFEIYNKQGKHRDKLIELRKELYIHNDKKRKENEPFVLNNYFKQSIEDIAVDLEYKLKKIDIFDKQSLVLESGLKAVGELLYSNTQDKKMNIDKPSSSKESYLLNESPKSTSSRESPDEIVRKNSKHNNKESENKFTKEALNEKTYEKLKENDASFSSEKSNNAVKLESNDKPLEIDFQDSEFTGNNSELTDNTDDCKSNDKLEESSFDLSLKNRMIPDECILEESSTNILYSNTQDKKMNIDKPSSSKSVACQESYLLNESPKSTSGRESPDEIVSKNCKHNDKESENKFTKEALDEKTNEKLIEENDASLLSEKSNNAVKLESNDKPLEIDFQDSEFTGNNSELTDNTVDCKSNDKLEESSFDLSLKNRDISDECILEESSTDKFIEN